MSLNLPKSVSVIFLLSLLLIPQPGVAQKDKVQLKNKGIMSPNTITYIDEDFSTASVTTPPAGWIQNIIIGEQGVDLWHFDNPGGRTLNPPITSPAAIFDSYNYSGNGQPENIALESPGFSPPAEDIITLEWDQYFNSSGGGVIFVEIWDGNSWNAIYSASGTTLNPDHQSIDISSISAGIIDTKVRFRWTGNWSNFWIFDNVKVHTDATTPNPAVAISPADGSVDIDINTILEWTDGGDPAPTGYRIYFGTDGSGITPPTNIENNTDLLLTTTYIPDAPLLYNTTYYWMIIPYNESGDATGNSIWSFSVMEDPPVTTFPYSEDFEGSFPPLYYIRYTGFLSEPVTLTPTNSGWEQGDWRNVTIPINKAAKLNISGDAINYWLMTTLVDFGTGTGYQLEFDLSLNAAGTSDPPDISGIDDRFAVVISTDGGTTWSTANALKLWDNTGSQDIYNDINYLGQHIIIDLSDYSGLLQFGFYGESINANADNDLMIDNIEVKEIPVIGPVFLIDPPELDFGSVAVGGQLTLQAAVSNTGTTDLIIEGVSTTDAQFAITPETFPITITSGSDQVFDITFTPAAAGSQAGSFVFIHNAAGSPTSYPVQGMGVSDGPTFSVLPQFLDFGNVAINTSKDLELTVSNLGLTNTLEITSVTIAEPGFTVIPLTASIPAGENQVFTVTFNPLSGGTYSADLIFSDNDPSSPQTVTLTGNAVDRNGLVFIYDTVYHRENDSYMETLQLTGLDPLGDKVQAIQFRLSVNKAGDDNTILTFQTLTKGTDVSDENWVLDYNLFRGPLTGNGASKDSIYVLLYNLDQDDGLDPASDYNDLLKVKYRVANLPALNDTVKSSFIISNATATTPEGYPIDITPSENELTVMAVNRISSVGDVNGDGYLDILDLIMVVDHIVGRDSLTGDYFTRADISPWLQGTSEPEPDGLVNVQDLSLIQNIILTGLYPDGSINNESENGGMPKRTGEYEAKVKLYISNEGISLYVDCKSDIRGAQIELYNLQTEPQNITINTDLGQGYYLQTENLLRTLLYDRLADKIISAGEHFLADMPFQIIKPENIQPGRIILVDINKHKIEKVEVEIIYGNAPDLPLDYILFQNYPNPFNPSTTIMFQVPQTNDVTIIIYNMLGQSVRTLFNKRVLRGTYSIQWDGLNNSGVKMSSGTYVYRMTAMPNGKQVDSFVKSNKMILLK